MLQNFQKFILNVKFSIKVMLITKTFKGQEPLLLLKKQASDTNIHTFHILGNVYEYEFIKVLIHLLIK